LLLLLLASSSAAAASDIINKGDCICTEGYIMDQYCIQTGRLLDNWEVNTLEQPGEHSLHCLLDVLWCVDSGFTVLGDPDESSSSGGLYTVAAKLDGDGTDLVWNFAVDRGKPGPCTECTGLLGDMTKGFRAAVVGIVDSVGDITSSDPLVAAPSITVTAVLEDGSCSSYTCPDTGGIVQGDAAITSAPSSEPSSKPSAQPTTNQPTKSLSPSVSHAPSPAPTPVSQETLDLMAAESKWGQPASYEFVFQRSCFCQPSYVQPMYVVVENGIKTNVTFIEEALAGSETEDIADGILTIEDQFRLIEQSLVGPYKADYISVLYDEERGYPLFVSIDHSKLVADEEVQIFNTLQL